MSQPYFAPKHDIPSECSSRLIHNGSFFLTMLCLGYAADAPPRPEVGLPSDIWLDTSKSKTAIYYKSMDGWILSTAPAKHPFLDGLYLSYDRAASTIQWVMSDNASFATPDAIRRTVSTGVREVRLRLFCTRLYVYFLTCL